MRHMTRANRIRELLRNPKVEALSDQEVAKLVGPSCRHTDVWAVRNRKPKRHRTTDMVTKSYRARREVRDTLQGWGPVKHTTAEPWAGERCKRRVGKKLCAGIRRVKGAPLCVPCQDSISANAERDGLARRGGGRL